MNTRKKPGGLNRRNFLVKSAAAIAFPTIVPSSVFGQLRPSNRITMGIIGWGMQGPINTKSFLAEDDCRVIAACDLDTHHLKDAVDTINEHYQNKDCAVFHDYRELLARPDIDAVMLAVPDHWHALVATEAARQKKDVYGEKPLAKTIAEQQAIVRAVEQHNIIWQTGSWRRSRAVYHKAAEIVRNGLLGKLTRVEVGQLSGHIDFIAQFDGREPSYEVQKPPLELDYETWIGPSKMVPYIEARGHMNWRWNYNTGGGMLMDWIGHHCDIAHWGMGCDDSGPSEIEGTGTFPPAKEVFNTATEYRVELKYPQDVHMTIAGTGDSDIQEGTKWIGTDGWLWVGEYGVEGSNPEWQKWKSVPEDLRKVKLYESTNHYRNFLDCVKSRKPTITPVQTAHHSSIPGHLGLISMLTKRKIRWDVEKEQIVGDAEAEKLLTREYRAPYRLG
ncbi:MAG TPA: Gfo/Idh/MocA family oxidoreductase [Verrucomicrobiae bacterium]|nr:Gfo/Idh/MocA family oxidoreductase [Verrucomicrobiae bacterium]